MEWWGWILIAIAIFFAYQIIKAAWWRRVSSSWEERRRGRLVICDKRLTGLSQYISNQETSGGNVKAIQVLRVEGDLHALADAQQKDRPDTADQSQLQNATVRYFELWRDIVKANREGREEDADRLQLEVEQLDAILGFT